MTSVSALTDPNDDDKTRTQDAIASSGGYSRYASPEALQMRVEAADQYVRFTLETLCEIAHLPLVNEDGEPLRNFQLREQLEERLAHYPIPEFP